MEDRTTPNAGGLDPSFDGDGKWTLNLGPSASAIDVATDVLVQPDGKIVLSGNATLDPPRPGGQSFAAVRLMPDGRPDPGFGDGGRVYVSFDLDPTITSYDDESARGAVLQPDGKIIIAGGAVTPTGGAFVAVRLMPDGTLDEGFGDHGKFTDPSGGAAAVAVLPDGRIILAGSGRLKADGAVPEFTLLRLTPNGDLDPTFGDGGRAEIVLGDPIVSRGQLNAMAIRPDGRIVVAGQAENDFVICQLDADGRLDASFSTDGVFYSGLVDPRPNAANQFNMANDVAIQSDGKVVAVGYTALQGSVAVRLTEDGVPDRGFGSEGVAVATFAVGSDRYADSFIPNDVAIQPDGRIVLAGRSLRPLPTGDFQGQFTAARLTANGGVDDGFGADGSGRVDILFPVPPMSVYDEAGALGVALQADGGIVLAGFDGADFTAVRLYGIDPSPPPPPVGPPPVSPPPISPPPVSPPVGPPVSPPVSPPPANPQPVSPSVVPSAPSLTAPRSVVVGGPNGTVTVYTPVGDQLRTGRALTLFAGADVGVRTATADVTGDGIPDVIGVTAPGSTVQFAVIDGATGAEGARFTPFESSYTGGAFVSAADLDGDGKAEVIVTPDQSGGPVVAIFRGSALAPGATAATAQMVRFFGIDDPNFRGGCRAAVGDVNGDGVADLIVSAGFGGGPRVAVFDGRTVGTGFPNRVVPDFFAFEPTLRNGAYVAAGDLDGDGFADLGFGGGPGGAPRVVVVSGKVALTVSDLTAGLTATPAGLVLANFFAGDEAQRSGVRVALRPADATGPAVLVVGSGAGSRTEVRVYSAATLASANPVPNQTFDPTGLSEADGVFIG